MALSDYEKQVLAQMEEQLREADPSLASVMTSSLPGKESDPAPGRFSPRRVALGSIIGIGGLAVVVLGVSFGYGWAAVLFGVLGFVLMVGGVLLALKTDPGAPRKAPTAREAAPKDFMARQQERWDRRGR